MPSLNDYARDWGATTIDVTGTLLVSDSDSPAFLAAPRSGVLPLKACSVVFPLYDPAKVRELTALMKQSVGNVPLAFRFAGDASDSVSRIVSYARRHPAPGFWTVTARVEEWKGAALP